MFYEGQVNFSRLILKGIVSAWKSTLREQNLYCSTGDTIKMQIKVETCLIHEFPKVLNLNLLKIQS